MKLERTRSRTLDKLGSSRLIQNTFRVLKIHKKIVRGQTNYGVFHRTKKKQKQICSRPDFEKSQLAPPCAGITL